MFDEYDSLPVIVILLDPRGCIQFCNAYFSQLVGYHLDDIRGRDLFALFMPAHAQQRLREAFLQAALAGNTCRQVHSINTRSGTKIEIEWSAQAMRDAGGEFTALLLGVQPAPEHIAAQQNDGRSEQLRHESNPVAITGSWELHLPTNELMWSDEIFHLFEIDKSCFGATYESFLNAIHPEDRDCVHHAYSRSLEVRAAYEISHRLLMADGRVKWVHECCVSEFDASGRPLRSRGTVQDITGYRLAHALPEQPGHAVGQGAERRIAELQQARHAAERANLAKSVFLSRLSHQLRTPLNGILGFAQLLAYDPGNALEPEQADYVREIMRSGRNLLEHISEIHDLGAIEKGSPQRTDTPDSIAPGEGGNCYGRASGQGGEEVQLPLQPRARNSGTVLYIEDNPSSVRLVQKSVSGRLGLSMLNARSAELGLEMARTQRPDIILLDINLPGMNGFEALGHLQRDKRTCDIPVVALTANAMERDIRRGLEAGFVEYLTKPLDIIQLVIVLCRLIHGRGMQQPSLR